MDELISVGFKIAFTVVILLACAAKACICRSSMCAQCADGKDYSPFVGVKLDDGLRAVGRVSAIKRV
jgi:hypothetical protein